MTQSNDRLAKRFKALKGGERTLREWRKQFRLSQNDLLELAGLGRDANARGKLSAMERGVYPVHSNLGERLAEAMDLDISQVLPVESPADKEYSEDWTDDGFALDAPRQTVKWWRERRGLSQQELSIRAGLSLGYMSHLEGGYKKSIAPKARRGIASALAVSPGKLIFPGDKTIPEAERTTEQILREELRGARRVLRRWEDVARDGRYLTHKAEDDLQDLIEATESELKGI